MTLEFILPLCRPAGELDRTVESLIAQTDKDFSVLVSDGYSASNRESVDRALGRLEQAGLPARSVSSSVEFDPVEHWNWTHYQATGDWLKPLGPGDRLESGYVARLREVIDAHASCRYVHGAFFSGSSGAEDDLSLSSAQGWEGRFRPAAEMRELLARHEVRLGPPGCGAYARVAFLALGGCPPAISSPQDSFFSCMLAANFGAFGLAEPMIHLRASSLPPSNDDWGKRATSHFEFAYYLWTEGLPFSVPDYLRVWTGALALRK